MHPLLSGRVRFGAFELDLSTGELRSNETPDPSHKVLLREQVFQVLRMLIEREGKIVTREEIKQRLWANDTVVDFDSNINATIKVLRRALGDSADSPQYIETLARRGYRLMPAMEYLEPAPGTAFEKDREQREPSAIQMSENEARFQRQIKRHWWRAAIGATSAVILVTAGYMSWRHIRSTAPPGTERIRLAILPFKNLTGDPNKEYLADGLTEETISQLSRLNPGQLGVIARTSVMGYKHKDVGLDEIGRDLSVQYVLENSLRENGAHIRLTTQLIQVKDQTHLWSQDYDYTVKDVLNIEDDVAKAVAQEIQLRLTSQQEAELARSHQVNPQAFEAYFQGRYLGRDPDVAVKYFEQATQLDPNYALAWVWLSRARFRQADSGRVPIEEGHRLAREAVERALALDPNLGMAHDQMGGIQQGVDFDWAGGDASFQRAMALEPGNPQIVGDAALTAAQQGRFDEALRLARRSLELDPLNARRRVVILGQLEYWMGALDEAVADFKRGLELSPEAPGHTFLAEIYVIQGRPRDALAEIKQERISPTRLEHYAIAYGALGRKKESEATLQELIAKYHTIAAFQIAQVYAFRKDSNEAFEWLDRAYAQHDGGLVETKVSPLLKSLHNDPRYAVLLKKLNLSA